MKTHLTPNQPRILVIRRDNIGDLVCTTPLFARLRHHFPQAHIAALVTEYNLPVLSGNPHLDAVFFYQKSKHRAENESWLGTYARRIALIFKLRQMRFDCVLLPGGPHPSAQRTAKLLGASKIIVRTQTPPGAHEVECVLQVCQDLGIHDTTPPPPTQLFPDPNALSKRLPQGKKTIGVHISARKPAQRWSAEKFSELIGSLCTQGYRVVLFWSPGAEDNPLHPGDDNKANTILTTLSGKPLIPMSTHTLSELIAGLACCDAIICSDGGAMHLAAGLGKPIVCFFGNSAPQRWRPWGVPHRVLQPASERVEDITVQEALTAFAHLMNTP
ncbi:MAG: glycosyltransferase family 9 protein [Magnetococcales bacterium]|nr:glycosyltransferase family 9 protein [Magnetococcales bacterium]